jgi:hypothetical protein
LHLVQRKSAPLLFVTTITRKIFPTVGKFLGVDNPEKKWHTAGSVPSKKSTTPHAPLLTVTTISPFVQGVDKAKKI